MKNLILASFVFSFISLGLTQKIVRSSIGTMGSSYRSNEILIQSTVGQSTPINTEKSENELKIRPGFNQPMLIDVLGNDLNVTISPNPSNGNFIINTNFSSDTQYNYIVVDQFGKVVESGIEHGDSPKKINIINAKGGMYFLTVQSGELKSSFKLTIIN